MRLINEKIARQASHEHYKKGQLGFEKAADTEHAYFKGIEYAEQLLKPLFVEFARWISEEYSWIDDAWLPKYSDSTTKYITTEDLFYLWLEQQTKK